MSSVTFTESLDLSIKQHESADELELNPSSLPFPILSMLMLAPPSTLLENGFDFLKHAMFDYFKTIHRQACDSTTTNTHVKHSFFGSSIFSLDYWYYWYYYWHMGYWYGYN